MFASRPKLQRAGTRRPGNILLLALLMLAGGLVGGLTVAALVVGELRQAKALDNGLVAYAQAESGLEQALYNIRQAKVCDSGPCNDTAYVTCSLPPGTAGNTTAACNRKISPATLLSVPYLDTNQNFQLDFSPPLVASCATPVSIAVNQWNRTALTGAQPALEISYIDQVPGAVSTRVYRPGLGLPNDCGATTANPQCSAINFAFPFNCGDEGDGTQLYQVRVKALTAPVSDLSFQLSGASSGSNYLDIWSQGAQSGTTQTLKTTVPKNPPAYGFSDYVIFSEQDIVK